MIERRAFTGPRHVTRNADGGMTFSGVAVPFGELSRVLRDRPRPYRERFERGSVRVADDTVMLYGHDLGTVPLARVGAGTLRFRDAADGLRFSADLAPGPVADALERGDLDGSVSVGFLLDEDEWQNRTKPAVRTVRAASLVELSVVMVGAYASARGSFS
jgi:HK97 family phage prohead protease